ncbi:diaminopimelate decarboxylase [Leptospira borgpetersenii]|uniref:Diaminopimelate decarboxylase n=2 Tax=Leptospira TaxID=171 RepID=Q04VQ9_LEPBJ|nr:diaminopimelate decarboxylase [Leptospira borgpetersenii]ABJ75011.1 Diaminopimelate decarboxylase [Leptospira borgpetersenii serovar Hardjo-bovis str. JB197]ABJ80133.1 Diaminopimelate decarboxylase [Leptospira borgpetersenii serovar Hardjo-bovis str. L550]AMX59584.1 diaminopimelate decarboxylase [Leptospira borgpetersenii serovar Hardjo]AMX62812.1 diaminopimelate decarboxylase [Leptospira borgpetersenii serovar Hardjo]AMX66055.1 diaminopimelate decarboxylase [Leptospira borgpetersenii serov
MQPIEKLKFLTKLQVRSIAQQFGTPIFVYSREGIEKSCDAALAFPNGYGLTVRYAMKANSNRTILEIIKRKGIQIDASSEYEVLRAIHYGFKPEEIMLTSQELAKNLKEFVEKGVVFNACSLRQLEAFGNLFPGKEVSVRFNPGLGSGQTKKTDVGGKTSSFGVWHEELNKVKEIASKYKLKIFKIHTHIGSGSDPEAWKAIAQVSLDIAAQFSECKILNLGGGFKVGRMEDEKTTNFQKIGKPVVELFQEFAKKHGTSLHLEIEPGSFLMVNNGSIISTVDDVVSTGDGGYTFVKIDAGMDVNTRPSLYAARHPLVVVPKVETHSGKTASYVYVGHCCESGDLFTQAEGGGPVTRITGEAQLGDYVVMEGAGAYCSSMSTKNYNSFPETAEVLVDLDGSFQLIRKRQNLEQIFQNEVPISL